MLKIVIHGYDQAIAALAAAAAADRKVLLMSARAAAAYTGPGWFRDLVAQACAAVPAARADSLLDCADRAGDALKHGNAYGSSPGARVAKPPALR